MFQYQLLVHFIVKKQAEVVHRTGKQTVYIVQYYKTELIKNIDTLTCCIVSRYFQNIAILRYIDTYRTSLLMIAMEYDIHDFVIRTKGQWESFAHLLYFCSPRENIRFVAKTLLGDQQAVI